MTDHEYLVSLEGRIKELENDRKSFFKTGIMILGAATLGMATYIWKTHI